MLRRHRQKLRLLRKHHKDHPLLASEQDITLTESDIKFRIERWRELQNAHMPHIKEADVSPSPSESEIEDERLYLPCYFSSDERLSMHLIELAKEEKEIRTSQVVECILQLRRSAKRLSAMRDLKKKNESGQKPGTRATAQRHSIEFGQNCLLAIYGISRQALISLDDVNGSLAKQFPSLTVEDLSRKPTTHTRQMGDSHRAEGSLWGINPRGAYIPPSPSLLAHPSVSRQRLDSTVDRPDILPSQNDSRASIVQGQTRTIGEVGKLWSPTIGLTSKEVELWELEGTYIYSQKRLC